MQALYCKIIICHMIKRAALQDYLTAPMPYLIGIPSPQLLRGLEHMGLEEVVFVDLDAGTCRLGSQDGPDMDSALLPWSHHLQAAFQVCPPFA